MLRHNETAPRCVKGSDFFCFDQRIFHTGTVLRVELGGERIKSGECQSMTNKGRSVSAV